MKRIVSIVIVLALAVMMVACEIAPEKTTEPSQVMTSGNHTTQKPSQSTSNINATKEITIQETLLVDEAGVKITAKSIDVGTFWGTEVKLFIENNSGKNLTFQCRNTSVNGYMIDHIMSVDVADGKKANDSLVLFQSELELCGISVIADIEMEFHIFDANTWDTYLDTNTLQLKTSAADTHQYTYDDSGELVYEGNGFKIVIKGLSEEDSVLGPAIVVYIENMSNMDITVQARDVSVNGFMVDEIFSCDITARKRAVDTIVLTQADLDKNGIISIEDVELYFHIFNSDGWETIVDTEVIQINF